MERVLVTGGAGFIGSHLVDALVEDHEVVVLDDLSGGRIENIEAHMSRDNFTFVQGSITSEEDISKALDGVSTVFHFAAQPDVRLSVMKPLWDFAINVQGSMLLLDNMRRRDIRRMIFASSGGTVYGDAEVFPTPESTPFRPISNYGAAKGAFEMYLSSYAELYGINSVSMRLANIIGPRSTHGVIYDFYMKLKRDPTRLEVLGDGSQEKAYMYVSDAVDAALVLAEKMWPGYQPVNVGSGQRLRVSRIAEIVRSEFGVPDARIEYTGSRRGWAGDVVVTDIDVSRLRSFGWAPKVDIEDGVRQYIRWLVETFGPVGV
ncbi:MAG: NAD-dependent epimerase/dehydratase family protein [Candidatus Thorarchaeota archaeon]